jgi:hypothetical protein
MRCEAKVHWMLKFGTAHRLPLAHRVGCRKPSSRRQVVPEVPTGIHAFGRIDRPMAQG